MFHLSHSLSRRITVTLSRIEAMAEGPGPNDKALYMIDIDTSANISAIKINFPAHEISRMRN